MSAENSSQSLDGEEIGLSFEEDNHLVCSTKSKRLALLNFVLINLSVPIKIQSSNPITIGKIILSQACT